ncbi:hypothetical protein [Agrobacterium sp. MCAB5]|uniref:hypothetical protein n=1 Tax=Agrobacterium sp. MCAB5 TaxID=3233042 RepID=UPI003F8E1C76
MAGRPPKEKSFANMLRIAINEASDAGGGTKLRAVAEALVSKAVAGDVQAIKEVADRLDGKVTQEISGPDGGPVQIDLTGFEDDELKAFAVFCAKLAGASSDDAAADTSGAGEEG